MVDAEELCALAVHAGRSGVLHRQGGGQDEGRCPACDGPKGDEFLSDWASIYQGIATF